MLWMEHLTNTDEEAPETSNISSTKQTTSASPRTNNENEEEPLIREQVSEVEKEIQLQSALDELEHGREKRKELEETIALLKAAQESQTQNQHRKTAKKKKRKIPISSATSTAVSDTTEVASHHLRRRQRQEFVALQSQVDGYRQLVDAMTLGKPAMGAAATAMSQGQPNTLSLNAVRFLELMPWHPNSISAAVVAEEIYEWQVYHPTKKEPWRSELAHFPTFIQALPLAYPSWNGREIDPSAKKGGFFSLPTTHGKVGVWTDWHLSHRYELRDGYLLPQSTHAPLWKWIGGWVVDVDGSNDGITAAEDSNNCCYDDDEGWSYAKDAGHFVETSSAVGLIAPKLVSKELARLDTNTTMVRRRKWRRKRVLVDYPFASENTQNYLKLIEEREERIMVTSKLRYQEQAAQQALNATEERHAQDTQLWIHDKRELEQQIKELQAKVKEQQQVIGREKGPHRHSFFFGPSQPAIPATVIKTLHDSDGESDADDDDDCASHCSSMTGEPHIEERLPSRHLMLSPVDHGTIVKETKGQYGTKTSLFGWIQQHQQGSNKKASLVIEKAAPEVEPSSDDSNHTSLSSSVEGEDGLFHFPTSHQPSRSDKKTSFLHLHLFHNKK